MSDTSRDGYVMITISGDLLDPDELSDQLGVEPYDLCHRGDVRKKTIAETGRWMKFYDFNVDCENPQTGRESLESALRLMKQEILDRIEELRNASWFTFKIEVLISFIESDNK